MRNLLECTQAAEFLSELGLGTGLAVAFSSRNCRASLHALSLAQAVASACRIPPRRTALT